MNTLRRIKAVLIQEYFITLNSMEVFMDIFFFPSMTIVLFGFLSSYLTGSEGGSTGHIVLMGMLLWEIVFIAQYSVSVGSLWNIWSRNLSNMFITPLDIREYIFAHVVSGSIKSLLVFLLAAGLSVLVFDYNIFGLGLINLFLFYINLLMFAVAVGLAILGLIFAYGTRIQAFAWGLLPIFQPLTAALYPVEVLPFPLKETAYIFPPTYIFESARKSLVSGGIVWDQILISFLINVLYVILSIIFFKYMFRRSRVSGQFARNEG